MRGLDSLVARKVGVTSRDNFLSLSLSSISNATSEEPLY